MVRKVRPDGQNTRERIYLYLKEYIERERIAPTYREIGEAVGLRSTSAVSNQIDKLVIAGRIKRKSYLPRTIIIVENVGDPNETEGVVRQS